MGTPCHSLPFLDMFTETLEPDIPKDKDSPKRSGDKCVNAHLLSRPTRKFFTFTDSDSQRNELKALLGSNEPYVGARNKDIYFSIKGKLIFASGHQIVYFCS